MKDKTESSIEKYAKSINYNSKEWRELVDDLNNTHLKIAKLAKFKDYYHLNYDNKYTLTEIKRKKKVNTTTQI